MCPHCGKPVKTYRNPFPTVDIIIEMPLDASSKIPVSDKGIPGHSGPGIVLIHRKNPPFGWALPGGFVDYGESLESAAIREAAEETSLQVSLLYQLGAYSDPARDPRHHTLSVVFVARATGVPKAADDATDIGVFHQASLPRPLAFDHEKILQDYFEKWCQEK
ncbi:MAG: NUDIX hydrolase [Deltaproteobacteria bacterium]|nr:NUDIX hydrolase [Deltaproteobacteria bacterium]